MQLFDGNYHAKKLEEKIVEYLSKNKVEGKLAIIQIGENLASQKYVTIKEKLAKKLSIPVEVVYLDSEKSSSLEVVVRGSDVIYSPSNKSVIIQLPLPKERFYSLLTKIPYEKDIDMLSEGSRRKFYSGDLSHLPPVLRSVEYFISSNSLFLGGKKALVVGNGDLVGKPVAFYLQKIGMDVVVTEDYESSQTNSVNLIVACAGVPNLIKGEDLPAGCNVIDFGSSVVNGKTVGDLDLNSKLDHLGIVSPSPGGMGPLVVRFLLMNHLGI